MLSINFLFLFSVFRFIFLAEEPRKKERSLITNSEQRSLEKDKNTALPPGFPRSGDVDQKSSSVFNSLESDCEKKVEEKNQVLCSTMGKPHSSGKEREGLCLSPFERPFKREKVPNHASTELVEHEKHPNYFYQKSKLENTCINSSLKREQSISFSEETRGGNETESNGSREQSGLKKSLEASFCRQLVLKEFKPELTTSDPQVVNPTFQREPESRKDPNPLVCWKKAFIRKREIIKIQMESLNDSWKKLTIKIKRFESESAILRFLSLKRLIASPCIKWLIKRRLDNPEEFNTKVHDNICIMLKTLESLYEFLTLKKIKQDDFFDQEEEEFFLIITNSCPLVCKFVMQSFPRMGGIFYGLITDAIETSCTEVEEESNILDKLTGLVMLNNPGYRCLKGVSEFLKLIYKEENSLISDYLFNRCAIKLPEDIFKEYPEVELGTYAYMDQLLDDFFAILQDFIEVRKILYEAEESERKKE